MIGSTLSHEHEAAFAPRSTVRGQQAIFGAGLVVILAAFLAVLLPLAAEDSGAGVLIGTMLMLAGSVEAAAGAFRPSDRAATILPGLVTFFAGAALLFEPFGEFVPQVRLIIAWLMARSILLGAGGLLAAGRLRLWTYVAALTDFTLAATLLVGLSASTFVFALFGATPAVVASFAWLLGASFLASGLLLIETARSAGGMLGD